MTEFAHVQGLSELAKNLRDLPQAIRDKHLRASVSEAASLVKEEAIALAPLWTGPVSRGHPPPGTLKKSIIAKFIPEESKNGKATFFVTVRGRRRGRSKIPVAYYWWWVEFGIPRMRARPYLRPAFQNKRGAALNAIVARLRRALEIESRRLQRETRYLTRFTRKVKF